VKRAEVVELGPYLFLARKSFTKKHRGKMKLASRRRSRRCAHNRTFCAYGISELQTALQGRCKLDLRNGVRAFCGRGQETGNRAKWIVFRCGATHKHQANYGFSGLLPAGPKGGPGCHPRLSPYPLAPRARAGVYAC